MTSRFFLFSFSLKMGGFQIPSKGSFSTNSLEHRIFQTIYFMLFEMSFTPTSILEKENNQSSEPFNYLLLITCHFPPFNMRQEHVVWMSTLPFDAHMHMHTTRTCTVTGIRHLDRMPGENTCRAICHL